MTVSLLKEPFDQILHPQLLMAILQDIYNHYIWTIVQFAG